MARVSVWLMFRFQVLGLQGPSITLKKVLDNRLGHQLAEVKVYPKAVAAKAARPQGTMICCLRCGASSQHRCLKFGQPCEGMCTP